MRIILYTGKGGVGKTSIAAATACRLAAGGSQSPWESAVPMEIADPEEIAAPGKMVSSGETSASGKTGVSDKTALPGKKVLIMSTDQAHSLGDAFETRIGSEVTTIFPGLQALEIDVVKESEQAWGNLQGYLKQMLASRAEGGLELEELLVFPGLEELFSLFKILDIYESGACDVLIVDCAPTGETLSLLKFPELFGSMLDKILPVKRKAARIAGPAVEKMTKIPMPSESVFDDIERFMKKMAALQALMQNKDVVSLRIVTTPEKIVIREAKRNFTCLHLYDYNVDCVIVNKVYPSQALEGYFDPWSRLQKEGMTQIRESFHDIPIFLLPLQEKELTSVPMLLKASAFYDECSESETRCPEPDTIYFRDKIFEVNMEEGLKLRIRLPFADKEELDLAQDAEELILSIRNEKRRFMLPDMLKGKSVSSARCTDGVLVIEFE